ncbi:MAG: hypothetical protein GYA56_06785 [Geobacteraceae bacterium]|nr:hypothetical protein [Geobacteraceae bacterium]
MSKADISPLDRSLARICELCPLCRHARRSQQGIAYSIVKNVEMSLCPFCRAYERVHGRKAHERAEGRPPRSST